MRIVREPSLTVPGPPENFTGPVWADTIATPGRASRLILQTVRFAPGSRTMWHAHPLGQVILITDGAGLVQRRDGPVEKVRDGDTVVFEPGEWHWHGADPESFMSHIAVQEVDAEATPPNAACTSPTPTIWLSRRQSFVRDAI